MTTARLRALRCAAQLLAGEPVRSAEHAVRHHLALQAQDLRAAQLALRARVPALSPQDVDRALNERAFVVTWANRGTLHFVCPEDVHWLVALTGPTQASALKRRLALDGIEPRRAERAIKAIARALADEGPLTRAQLVERTGIEGQPFIHVAFAAAYRGVMVRGPLIGRQHAYVRTEDWIGPAPKRIDRDASLAELARRYLVAFGPATEADLAYWSGLPKRDARAGLAAIATELTQHDGGLVDLKQRRAGPDRAPSKLLPLWDNYLLGWKDRGFQIDPEHTLTIYANGMIGPAAARGGMLVGGWTARNGRVVIEPFDGPVTGFAAETKAVERFMARR
jgi:Winged helix DNA-binding domain